MRGRAGPLGRNGRDLRAQTRARTSRLQTPGVGASIFGLNKLLGVGAKVQRIQNGNS